MTGVLLAARVLTRVPEGERQAYAARLAQERDLFAYVAAEVLSGEPGPFFHVTADALQVWHACQCNGEGAVA